MAEAKSMSADEAREAIANRDDSVRVADIRSVEEFGDGHIPGAVNVPDADAAAVRDAVDDGDEVDRVLVVCADGKRSREVASELGGEGVEAAFLDGGMKKWERKHPVEPPASDAEFQGPKNKPLY